MELTEIILVIIKISIVVESLMLGLHMYAQYMSIISGIKNGLSKSLSMTFISAIFYSIIVMVSLFIVNAYYPEVKDHTHFPLLVVLFFLGRLFTLVSRVYLGHEIRKAVLLGNVTTN